MSKIANNTKTLPQRSIGQWLFNPFAFVAGYQALLLGLGIILISAFIGFRGNTHFDGVLDVHKGFEIFDVNKGRVTPLPLWLFLAEGIIDWLTIAIPLFFFSLVVSSSPLRMIDVFGTLALARWPYLITAIVMLPEANRKVGVYLAAKFGLAAAPAAINCLDIFMFGLAVIVGIFMAVLMVALMYRAYTLSCNIKGIRAIITFIISLIGAEALSKMLILLLFEWL